MSETREHEVPGVNIEAEQAFLGALLYENEIYEDVSSWLKPEHFYEAVHARMYKAAAARIAEGKIADAVTLKNQFDDDEGLEELGGAIYLADLMREAPDPRAGPEYARTVYELSYRRSLSDFGQSLAKEAYDTRIKFDDLVDSYETQFSQIRDLGAQVDFVTVTEGLTRIRERAAEREAGTGGGGLKTGLRALDDRLGGLSAGDLLVIAGDSGMGKTALADNIAYNVASAGGFVYSWSGEMTAVQKMDRLIALDAQSRDRNLDITRMRKGIFNANEREAFEEAERSLAGLDPYLLLDCQRGLSISEIRAHARQAKARMGGLDFLVIDYIGLVRLEMERGQTKADAMGRVAWTAKEMGGQLGCVVALLSQLNRGNKSRENKRPQQGDVKESGAIEEHADVIVFPYREEYWLRKNEPQKLESGGDISSKWRDWHDELMAVAGRIEIISGKVRQGEEGTDRFAYNAPSCAIKDIPGVSLDSEQSPPVSAYEGEPF